MKKIISVLLTLMLVFTMSACSADKLKEGMENPFEGVADSNGTTISADNGIGKGTTDKAEEITTTEAETVEPTDIRENKSLTEIQAAYMYNEAYEVASAWFNFGHKYWDRDDRNMTDYGAYYYSIKHDRVNSLATLKEYLCGYFTESIVDQVIEAAYFEENGKLYHVCFSAGDALPTNYLDFTTAELISDKENKAVYNITVKSRFSSDILYDGNPDRYDTIGIEFVFENGKWVIGNHFSRTLYAPYEWDGKSPLYSEEEKTDSKDSSEEKIKDTSDRKIVTEKSDNVMMAFYDKESKEYSDKLFSFWAGNATLVEFEKSYPKALNLTNDTSLVKPDSSYALDISEAGNGSVVAYLTTEKSDTVLHIAGKDGVVMANENSSHVFDGEYDENNNYFSMEAREIRFNSCFNTSNATDMDCMFRGCDVTQLDLSGFDTSNVTSMMNMFGGCINLTHLDLSCLDTSNVSNMSLMFATCINLVDLNLSGFNTEKVTTMDNMFSECESFTQLDLSDLHTPNVTSMYALFNECKSLVHVDMSNFDTSNVKDMGFMFAYCESLASLDLSNFSTSNVTSMKTMFYNCKSLTYIDVSSFDTSNVTNFGNMFNSCSALTALDVSSFDTSKCKSSMTVRRSVFEGCYNAEIIYNGQVYKYGRSPDLYALENDFFHVED